MLSVNSLFTSDNFLKTAWKGLTRRLQTTVETCRVINGEATALVRGEVMRMGGDRIVLRADAVGADPTDVQARAVGVMTQDVAIGGSGILRNDNVAFVLFETGLDGDGNDPPICGEWCYVSATAGRATTPSEVAGNYEYCLGLICDASMYDPDDATTGCMVLLDRTRCDIVFNAPI